MILRVSATALCDRTCIIDLVKYWTWILLILAAIGGAGVIVPAAPQDEPGERLINQRCTSCHDVRRIQVQAMDKDEWTTTINNMIAKGANVSNDELPVLLDYLMLHHGPLPDGPGKDILLNTCTMCHDLKRIKEHGGTRLQWEETLQSMLNEGAPLSDDEFPVILGYLARNFRPIQ